MLDKVDWKLSCVVGVEWQVGIINCVVFSESKNSNSNIALNIKQRNIATDWEAHFFSVYIEIREITSKIENNMLFWSRRSNRSVVKEMCKVLKCYRSPTLRKSMWGTMLTTPLFLVAKNLNVSLSTAIFSFFNDFLKRNSYGTGAKSLTKCLEVVGVWCLTSIHLSIHLNFVAVLACFNNAERGTWCT